jgi:hypothetical protein
VYGLVARHYDPLRIINLTYRSNACVIASPMSSAAVFVVLVRFIIFAGPNRNG